MEKKNRKIMPFDKLLESYGVPDHVIDSIERRFDHMSNEIKRLRVYEKIYTKEPTRKYWQNLSAIHACGEAILKNNVGDARRYIYRLMNSFEPITEKNLMEIDDILTSGIYVFDDED